MYYVSMRQGETTLRVSVNANNEADAELAATSFLRGYDFIGEWVADKFEPYTIKNGRLYMDHLNFHNDKHDRLTEYCRDDVSTTLKIHNDLNKPTLWQRITNFFRRLI